jgi:thioredoxin-like negative regulator of GroEL
MEIIKFSAVWCGPCKAYKAVFEDTIAEYSNGDINVIEADVDVNADLVKQHAVRTVPTTIFLKNNVELHRINSALSKEELTSVIDRFITI